MIKYGIVSYHRPECITFNTLSEIGIPNERIIICLNDPSDYEKYHARYGEKVRIVVRAGNNVAHNRNTVLETYADGERVVILDDDLKAIKRLAPANNKSGLRLKKIETVAEFEGMLRECFEACEKTHASFFGLYPVENEMFMSTAVNKDGLFSKNKIFQGGLFGFIRSELRFDDSYSLQEDYEIILREISRGHCVLRRNDITMAKEKMRQYKGGCFDRYEAGQQPVYLKKLKEQYPELINLKKDMTGIRLKRR